MQQNVLGDRIDLANTTELWQLLDRAYEDPDRQGTAMRGLQTLRLGKKKFAHYLAEFMRFKVDTGWDDVACIEALRKGYVLGKSEMSFAAKSTDSRGPSKKWPRYSIVSMQTSASGMLTMRATATQPHQHVQRRGYQPLSSQSHQGPRPTRPGRAPSPWTSPPIAKPWRALEPGTPNELRPQLKDYV